MPQVRASGAVSRSKLDDLHLSNELCGCGCRYVGGAEELQREGGETTTCD